MTYSPSLDGLRAVAVLAVMLFHARAPVGLGGFLGVDVFFVLSGYLITSLLLGEYEATGRVALARFWWRRVLRLTPALLVMAGVFVLAAPFLWPGITDHGMQALVAAAYLADYGVAWWRMPRQLNHTWSLAVEMHFYLAWPLVLLLARRRWPGASLASALLAAWLLATLWRWFWMIQGHTWEQVYYRADTRLSGLLLGAALAAALRDVRLRAMLRRAVPWLLWAAVAAIICLQFRWHDLWMLSWGMAVAEIGTAAVLLAVQQPAGQVAAMLSRPPLPWLGKMSYGMYLWHYPVFLFLRDRHAWDMILLVGMPASLALAAASYYTVEAWAFRRRRAGIAPQVA